MDSEAKCAGSLCSVGGSGGASAEGLGEGDGGGGKVVGYSGTIAHPIFVSLTQLSGAVDLWLAGFCEATAFSCTAGCVLGLTTTAGGGRGLRCRHVAMGAPHAACGVRCGRSGTRHGAPV